DGLQSVDNMTSLATYSSRQETRKPGVTQPTAKGTAMAQQRAIPVGYIRVRKTDGTQASGLRRDALPATLRAAPRFDATTWRPCDVIARSSQSPQRHPIVTP